MSGVKGPHLVLVGLMGAGKTTVGARCAARLGRPFVDVDDVVETLSGHSVRDVFRTEGEAGFRALERQAVADVCASPAPLVIACGGGAVLDAENRRRLRNAGVVIWLRAVPRELARRVASGDEAQVRPLLEAGEPADILERLLDVRTPSYEATADTVVDTDGRTVDEVADAVVEELARCDA